MCLGLRWHIGACRHEILGSSWQVCIDTAVLAATSTAATWATSACRTGAIPQGRRISSRCPEEHDSQRIATIIVTHTVQPALLFPYL